MQIMNYQRMSSSPDCSDEDDGKQPSSLLKYWEEIRPSSTDDESEPEVAPAKNQRLDVSSSTEYRKNEINDMRNENFQAENITLSQTSSMSHTNQPIQNIAPVHVPVHAPVHAPQIAHTHDDSRDEIIENGNSSRHLIPVADYSQRPAVYDPDQQFIMHQQWRSDRSDTDLLPENNFKDHCCWQWIHSDQFKSCYRCFICFAAFLAPIWLALHYVFA